MVIRGAGKPESPRAAGVPEVGILPFATMRIGARSRCRPVVRVGSQS